MHTNTIISLNCTMNSTGTVHSVNTNWWSFSTSVNETEIFHLLAIYSADMLSNHPPLYIMEISLGALLNFRWTM